MFNTLTVSKNTKNNTTNIYGILGTQLSNKINKLISKKKVKSLFISQSMFQLEFYDFFTLEVVLLIKNIISTGNRYGVNVLGLTGALASLEETSTGTAQLDLSRAEEIMKYKPLPYQLTAMKEYETFKNRAHTRGMLLDMATGSGKTNTSLAIAEAVNSNKIVIVAPNETIYKVWSDSLTTGLYKEPQDFGIMTSSFVYNDERIILTNYENLDNLKKIVPSIKGSTTTIIIDEVHNFADSSTKRTKALLEIVDLIDSDNVIPMSGTPIKAYTTELGLILRLTDKRYNSSIEKRFNDLYRSPTTFLKEVLPLRFKTYAATVVKTELKLKEVKTSSVHIKLTNGDKYTLPAISRDMLAYYHERTEYYTENMSKFVEEYDGLYAIAKEAGLKDNVNKALFESYENNIRRIIRLHEQRSLAFNTELMSVVNRFEKEVICKYLDSEQTKQFNNVKTIVKYYTFKIQGEILSNVLLKARIECHIDIAKKINYSNLIDSSNKKTLIFSNYIAVCDAVMGSLHKKYKAVSVYGNNTKNRNNTIDIFKSDKKVRALVTTYKSLSTGVPLIEANVIGIIDLPYRMYIYEQAVARAWRLGQDEEVFIYKYVLDTGIVANINTRGNDIIQFFKDEVERITGSKTSVELEDTLSTECFDIVNNKPDTLGYDLGRW